MLLKELWVVLVVVFKGAACLAQILKRFDPV